MDTASVLVYSNVLYVRQDSAALITALQQFVKVPVQVIRDDAFDRRVRGGVFKREGEGESATLKVAFDKVQPELFCFAWDGKRPGLVWYAEDEQQDANAVGEICSCLALLPCFKPEVRWTLYRHSGKAGDSQFVRIGAYRTKGIVVVD